MTAAQGNSTSGPVRALYDQQPQPEWERLERHRTEFAVTYRSHFGRIHFGGVTVEIIGDLHRREGETWVPGATRTQATVDVDGIPVRVSWLEEEALAYIRRGRLDRAAQCLPHCDAGRLLAVLHREQAAVVL